MNIETENFFESLSLAFQHGDKVATIVKNAKDREVVLLGEASHGTAEYYRIRIDISKTLIQEHGFRFVAVEGDWPSCFAINEYIKGSGSNAKSAREILMESFERWPRWMWANEEVEEFVEWLKKYNETLPEDKMVGFYGLDIYSLWESLEVLAEHFKNDEASLHQIYRTFACFEPYGRDEQRYAQATMSSDVSCEELADRLLDHIFQTFLLYKDRADEWDLSAKMNAQVIKNAERYYRNMIRSDISSWNIRDYHMDAVLAELRSYFDQAKCIVWAHNTHIGDAKSTHMTLSGMVNIGQLVRRRYGEGNVYILGFGSYTGTVLAAETWGELQEVLELPPARPNSWERLLHEYALGKDVLLVFDESSRCDLQLIRWRDHRAVGVVYQPDYESGNYAPSNVAERYDAFWFVDTSHAIKSLAYAGELGELETYPSGV